MSESSIITSPQVHYFLIPDEGAIEFAKSFNTFTNDYQGVFKIGACNCDEEIQICSKETSGKTPIIKIYPPMPIPAFDYEGPLDVQKILLQANKYLQSNVVEINDQNINTFISENPSVPKAFLFTDKAKGIPIIYKGLSISFEVLFLIKLEKTLLWYN